MNLNSVRFPGLDGEYKIPQTAADVGAAPAGYGLGEYGCDLPLVADADTCHKNGWYFINGATVNGIGASAVMRVDSYSSTHIVQTAYCGNWSSAYFVIQQRIKHEGEWGEWEWVNPPMISGVEYRTTERWNGKVVYAQGFDFGYLPNNTFKSEPLPVSTKVTHLVDYYGHMRYSTESAEISMTYAAIRFQLGYDGIVRIDTSENLSTFAAKFVVKYTKD